MKSVPTAMEIKSVFDFKRKFLKLLSADKKDDLEMLPLVAQHSHLQTDPIASEHIRIVSDSSPDHTPTSRDHKIDLDWTAESKTSDLHTIIFDCASWFYIDTMGIDALKQVSCYPEYSFMCKIDIVLVA